MLFFSFPGRRYLSYQFGAREKRREEQEQKHRRKWKIKHKQHKSDCNAITTALREEEEGPNTTTYIVKYFQLISV